ncbi:MAG: hypothetical protein ACOYO1_03310 [Bacteroidales bacterium]
MENDITLESLLYDSSKITVNIAADLLEAHPEQIVGMLLLCKSPYPLSMRAARVMQIYCEKHPNTIFPFLTEITEELLKTKVDGVKRSFLKILTFVPKISSLENSAFLFDKCLEWLFSTKEAIAVRAYCIDVLIKFVNEEPELKNEISLAFENLSTIDSRGLINRYNKAMNLIKYKKS